MNLPCESLPMTVWQRSSAACVRTKMLRIENLHAEIDGKKILNGLTLSVGAGEVHAIMGPNGAGKSTLGYVLGGRPGYEVTDGSITFDGKDLLDMEQIGRASCRERV